MRWSVIYWKIILYLVRLNRTEVERIVGNQYNRLLRQQQDLKTLSASKGTITADCGKGKNRRSRNKFEGNIFC